MAERGGTRGGDGGRRVPWHERDGRNEGHDRFRGEGSRERWRDDGHERRWRARSPSWSPERERSGRGRRGRESPPVEPTPNVHVRGVPAIATRNDV